MMMRDRLLQEARALNDEELVFVIDYTFVLICGFLCFLLQAGFGLLEVGGVRAKNAKNIMIKNIMDACVSALAYWVSESYVALLSFALRAGRPLTITAL